MLHASRCDTCMLPPDCDQPTNQSAHTQEGLEMFIEVAEAHPRFLRKQLTEVVQAVLQVGVWTWDVEANV